MSLCLGFWDITGCFQVTQYIPTGYRLFSNIYSSPLIIYQGMLTHVNQGGPGHWVPMEEQLPTHCDSGISLSSSCLIDAIIMIFNALPTLKVFWLACFVDASIFLNLHPNMKIALVSPYPSKFHATCQMSYKLRFSEFGELLSFTIHLTDYFHMEGLFLTIDILNLLIPWC